MATEIRGERSLLTLTDIARRIGVSRPRLWSLRKEDATFPQPVLMGKARAVRFRVAEIEAWEASLPRDETAA